MAFLADAVKDLSKDFEENYNTDACQYEDNFRNGKIQDFNSSNKSAAEMLNETLLNVTECHREHSILYLLLTLCTVWLGLYLFTFTKTPFLNANKREILADYSLPAAVLFMSFIGSYVFKDVDLQPFNFNDGSLFRYSDLAQLPNSAIWVAMALGFGLSLLFFMDQNISQAMVNNPKNKMMKGSSYHWDLLVVGLLNGVLAFFGMPMVHGALPHSPLHVRAMADMEDHVDGGHVSQEILRVRETRVTPILSHILIGVSLFLLPHPLSYIPRPVLDGLFLYLAATALYSNELFERVTLLVTEQAAYPPNHYVRSVPQKKIHLFTSLQLLQLAALCALGFTPISYCKMVFPVLLMILIPIRHKILPLLIENKYLNAMDGH